MDIQYLKQIGEVKKLNKVGASWADQIKKTVVLKCFLLFYAVTTNLFLIGL